MNSTARLLNVLLWAERSGQGKESRIRDENALFECQKQELVKENKQGTLELTPRGIATLVTMRQQHDFEVLIAETLQYLATRSHLTDGVVQRQQDVLHELVQRQWVCFNDYDNLEITPLGVEKLKTFAKIGQSVKPTEVKK